MTLCLVTPDCQCDKHVSHLSFHTVHFGCCFCCCVCRVMMNTTATSDSAKTPDVIGYWRYNRRFCPLTPSHSVLTGQKALVFDGFHAFPMGRL
jgi:hypothetical protein